MLGHTSSFLIMHFQPSFSEISERKFKEVDLSGIEGNIT